MALGNPMAEAAKKKMGKGPNLEVDIMAVKPPAKGEKNLATVM